ncbi:hypothetical protein [Pseudoclavibacter sp. JSM 162008]|uniref:hypothetical protein n=1 Tax=Pseudoclavibacter sp. JSM 162008 TaxID=3229855 RepID=UPI003523B0E8
MTIPLRKEREPALAKAASATLACLALLTGCASDSVVKLPLPTPLEGLPVPATYELEPVAPRLATNADLEEARSLWAEGYETEREQLGIPHRAVFLDEGGTMFRIVRISSPDLQCGTAPLTLEVVGDEAMRITIGTAPGGGGNCLAIGHMVVDELELPREVTGRPISVELVDNIPSPGLYLMAQ